MTEYLLIASTAGDSAPETVFMREILPRGLEVTNVRTPRGYNVEIAIPTSYLNRQHGGDWQAFRLDVRMSDYDAGEKTGDECPAWAGGPGGKASIPSPARALSSRSRERLRYGG